MNNINNITDKIISDANAYTENLEKETQKQVEEILNSYKKEAEKSKDKIIDKSTRAANEKTSRASSAQKLRERNMLLSTKSEIIDEAFVKATDYFINLEKESYIDFLLRLFSMSFVGENTEICLNQTDLELLGTDFFEKAKNIFLKKYPNLAITLSEKPVNILRGFILKNGDVEINCSLESLMSLCREKSESEVYKILFD